MSIKSSHQPNKYACFTYSEALSSARLLKCRASTADKDCRANFKWLLTYTMTSRKYFGTDGIRGTVGESPIRPRFFLKFGWALGSVIARRYPETQPTILIGKDTRVSGYMFESALEAGLIAAGVNVGLLGPMPTPAIAYLTRTFKAKAGIVISASHNPYQDNGIKLFDAHGTKLSDSLELEIEEQLDSSLSMAAKIGKAKRLEDAAGRYVEFCKGTLPWGFSLEGMRIVLDCANGATYAVAPKVFEELGAEVIAIGASPDGENINLNCGSTSPQALQQKVRECRADLGIAFDGDGDRVAFVDSTGELVDGDQLIYLIARHQHKKAGGCSGVVGTLMSNFGFELALKDLGIPFERANVGDRYVIEAMKRNKWSLGGESSGHIVCSDKTTTGDGIIAALQVIAAIKTQDETLDKAVKSIDMLPQTMINVRMAEKQDMSQNKAILACVADAEKTLAGTGRVLLRPSGTEPLIRVMVEGKDPALVSQLARNIAAVVESELSELKAAG